jgi:hypothetical protein
VFFYGEEELKCNFILVIFWVIFYSKRYVLDQYNIRRDLHKVLEKNSQMSVGFGQGAWAYWRWKIDPNTVLDPNTFGLGMIAWGHMGAGVLGMTTYPTLGNSRRMPCLGMGLTWARATTPKPIYFGSNWAQAW